MAVTPAIQTIDDYIQTFPEDVRQVLQELRRTVREAAPDAVETVSYQMPTFKLHGRTLVHFAAYKHHIGVYPLPEGDEAFQREIAPYKRAKATVGFPLDKPVPYHLLKQIVLFRRKEEQ